MAKLSKQQRLFLVEHDIPLSKVFNATGMARSEYRSVMSELGMIVAYGVTPCEKYGHTLRTRAGHCAQCKPDSLSFVKRWDEAGEVYVAHSAAFDLVKIGVAKCHQERMRTLNKHGYGGATDWRMRYFSATGHAGRVESLAQQSLSKFRAFRTYHRAGQNIDCQELFQCNVPLAISAVKSCIGK